MPIRPELRHHYRSPEYLAARKRVLKRARGRCEQCGARAGDWYRTGPKWNRRDVLVMLTVAHLDHDPANNKLENLKALCRACHLRHDAPHHAKLARATRRDKKDAQRPLLALLA